ncbi:uncharacterized protein LOC129570872, partial [Sitodiplosis mosellana]|uniref:uncharacterized protein LOC129570872 n=1 Tax=Sitodiplosis mosellana TaxID=263140 RepID=UPI002444A726
MSRRRDEEASDSNLPPGKFPKNKSMAQQKSLDSFFTRPNQPTSTLGASSSSLVETSATTVSKDDMNVSVNVSEASKVDLNPIEEKTTNTAPDDITPIGQEMKLNEQIQKLKTVKFPKTATEKDKRSFQLQWINRYNWIEYSISRDAIFCFICRQFGEHSQEQTFTTIGFNKWRTALSDGKGLVRHNASAGHMTATARYAEKLIRTEMGKSVSELLNPSVLEKRHYYVRSIVEIIVFLVSN